MHHNLSNMCNILPFMCVNHCNLQPQYYTEIHSSLTASGKYGQYCLCEIKTMAGLLHWVLQGS